MNSRSDERPLPRSLEAEEAVIAALIVRGEMSAEAIAQLSPSDFTGSNQTLFACVRQMILDEITPELTLIRERLHLRNEEIAVVARMIDQVPKIRNEQNYIQIVKNKARLRDRILKVGAVEEMLRSANGNGDEVLRETAEMLAAEGRVDVIARDDRLKIVTAPELLDMKVKPREWQLEGSIVARSMNEIFAWRGVGKTWFALSIAHAIATGGQFLKWNAPRPRPVLFVDGELDAASLQQRIRSLDATAKSPAANLKFLCCDMQDDPFPHLATRRAQTMIEDALGDSELLVLDNLSALAPSSNDQEGEDWTAIQNWLLDLRRRGASSLFLHHAGHAGHARGTTRREDLLDLVIELRWPKDYVASEGLRFEIHFTKTRGMLSTGAGPIEASLGVNLDGNLQWTWRDLEDVRAKQVCEMRAAGQSFREIENITGIPRSTAERLSRKYAASQ